MARITRVKWFTQDRMALISEDNKKKYKKYLQSSIVKNSDVKETTYKTYENFFNHFLCFLAVNFDNVGLYSEDFMENAVDIMESYMLFCQDTLKNHKKVINTKLSAVSSFYIWSMKRGYVTHHPFDKKLDRMKKANEEHIINSYFLTEEQVMQIRRELNENDKYDIQDQILFEIAYDSANRIGALERLTLSALDIDNMVFTDIREKEGYRVEVMFENSAKELIEEWLDMRKDSFDLLQVDSLLIVKNKNGWSPMKRNAIHYRMRKFGRIIDIDDFRAHCMRKSKLNNVYDETGDLTLAAELANHKSTETTRQSYVKPKSKAELRQRINELKERNRDQNL